MTAGRDDFVEAPYEPPRDELEKQVAKIVAEVLGVDRVGRDDSFYDFGGTSLQAIRICARIERGLGMKALPLWFFSHDILHEFVQELRTKAETAHV
ncbi:MULTISPECIES: phosphopantetheine-binding protein [unclassified Streptomyces]|uniref:phosphopantetheine-binding protein n=1 Tax=unclassified Streptomyces TaxID=2593676 RepID=UPI000933C96F|nr:phosphopantetheine-binding protein [Streptomyces sp. NBRC 110465]